MSTNKKKQPYSAAELKHFRALLLERRARLLGSVEAMEEEALKSAGQDFSVDHMADHGSDNFEQDLTISLVETERKELADIDEALMRIEQGNYGDCLECGEPINPRRLEADPAARLCIDCAE